MTDEHGDLIDAFEDLLEAERALLLGGDIGALGRLLPEKEALLGRLALLDPATEGLDRLKKGLARNGAMLGAAAQGVRDAGARLRALAGDAPPLATYDDQGRRQTLGTGGPSVSRSA